jgi:hypothetical protein
MLFRTVATDIGAFDSMTEKLGLSRVGFSDID